MRVPCTPGCGGERIVLGDRAWCAKPSQDGGCGGHFQLIGGKWKRTGKSKVGRIEPRVKS